MQAIKKGPSSSSFRAGNETCNCVALAKMTRGGLDRFSRHVLGTFMMVRFFSRTYPGSKSLHKEELEYELEKFSRRKPFREQNHWYNGF
jgi:hypothetical protein